MAISNINYSNTFGHWLISTNQAINELNNIKSNNYTKSSGTLFLDSSAVGLSVSNNSLFSGNTTFTGGTAKNLSVYVPSYLYQTLNITANSSIIASGNVSISGIFTGIGSGLSELNANNIASGTVPSARLGSGTANANTVLYGDGSWKYVSGMGGNGLTATEVKTSNYSANPSELVRCNSSSGSFTITLSATPTDGDRVGVLDVNNAFGTYAVTVSPNGKTIEGDATGLILDLTGTYIEFIYNATTQNWRIAETPIGNLDNINAVQTLTNKTINLSNNTISGTLAQFNTAVSDADLVSLNGSETLTNKTINLSNNTISGNLVQFNTAVSDADLASLNGSETLTNKTITGFKETKISLSANTVDLSTGNYFSKTISGATTLTVSNVAAANSVSSFILDLTNGGSATITWWSGVKWASGTAPTLTASGRDVLGFFTHDGGTIWNGLLLGKDLK